MQMSYDALGNLKQASLSDGNLIRYDVDGLSHRLSRVATKGALPGTFRYFTNTDGTIYAASYQGDAAHPGTKFYQFAYATSTTTPSVIYIISTDTNGKVVDGNVYKVVMDERGSVRQLIDEEGNIAQLMNYDEFGNIIRDTNPGFQPFGFAGGIYDPDTKLVHFGAREYDPSIGRWISRDPIGFVGGDTNLYGYVLNDPINYIDPSGNITAGQIGQIIVGGAVIGGAVVAAPILFGATITGGAIACGAAAGGALGAGYGLSQTPLGQQAIDAGKNALNELNNLLNSAAPNSSSSSP